MPGNTAEQIHSALNYIYCQKGILSKISPISFSPCRFYPQHFYRLPLGRKAALALLVRT